MQRQDQSTKQQDSLESMQQSLQSNIFLVITHLLQNIQHFSPWVFFLLESFETIQILRFSLHPVLTFSDSTIGVPQVKILLNYLSVDYLLKQHPEELVAILTILSVVVLGYVATIATVWYYSKKPMRNMSLWNMLLTFCNVLVLISNNLLVIPLTQLSCNVVRCTSSSWSCYDATYTILSSISIILAAVMIVSLIIYAVLFYLKNPFNRCFMSKPGNISKLAKATVKIAAATYFIIDANGIYLNVYIYGYAVALGGYLFFFRQLYHGNQTYFYFGYFCELSLIMFSLTTIMQYYVSQKGVQELSLLYTLICAVPVCFSARQIDKMSKENILYDNLKEKSSESSQQFVRELIQVIQDNRQNKTQILLLSIVKLVHANCQIPSECPCLQYFQMFKPSTKKCKQRHLESAYIFINYVLSQNSKSYPKNLYFSKTLMYLYYFRMQSKIKSMIICNQIADCKTSLSQKLELYMLRMQFKDQAKKDDTFMDIDFAQLNSYSAFNEAFMELEDKTEQCTQKSIQFWYELLQDNPSLLRMSSLSSQVKKLRSQIADSFELCINITPFSLKATEIYANFLLNVVQSPEAFSTSSHLIESLIRHDQQTNMEARRMLNKVNKKSCIFRVGATKGIVGSILSCNSEVKQLFGYDRWELTGQKITKVMPKIYHNIHDKMLKEFIQQQDQLIRPKRIKIPTLNKKGFLVMCEQLFKITASQQYGFQFISFLTQEAELNSPNYVIYSEPSGQIEAISQMKFDRSNIQKLPTLIMNVNIAIMFPRIDLSLASQREDQEFFDAYLDKRLFFPGITREEIQLLELIDTNDYDLPVKLCIEKVTKFDEIKIKRIKFFIEDNVNMKLHRSLSSQVIFTNSMQKLQKQLAYYTPGDEEKAASNKISIFIEKHKISNKIRILKGIVFFNILLWCTISILSMSLSLNQTKIFSQGLQDLNKTTELSVLTGNIVFRAIRMIKLNQLNLNINLQYNRLSKDLEMLSDDLRHLTAQSRVKLPSDTFQFLNGNAHLSLVEGLSELVYSGVRLSTNKSTISDTFYIEKNSPVRIPSLLTFVEEQQRKFLQKYIENEGQIKQLIAIITITTTILTGVVFSFVIVNILKFKQKMVEILNCFEVKRIFETKDECEHFMLNFFELNQIIRTVKNNKQIILALNQLAQQKDNGDEQQNKLFFQAPKELEEPEVKLIRPIALLSIKNKPSIIAAYIFVICILFADFLIERSIRITPKIYLSEFKVLNQMVRNNKQLTVFASLVFLNGKYQHQFYQTAKQLYVKAQQFYSSNDDDIFNRKIIYGQIQSIKTILQIQKATPGKLSYSQLINPISQLDIVQKRLSQQSSDHLEEIKDFMQNTYSRIARLKCAFQIAIFWVIILVIWKYLLIQLRKRCDSLKDIARMLPQKSIYKQKLLMEKLDILN